ncbi:hypothetical protein V1T76_28705, partial [Roseibium sp. FZY0029]|uniref:hypothetical protein n=1 Tax=Roseibium sp. FZY0029 TaxID=3116647 RepID=UPI002EAD6106|nr:hypothetical protein [Roseibium sp. FZY0029]
GFFMPKPREPEMFHFAKPARAVHTTWLHCSASDNPKHDDVSVIDADMMLWTAPALAQCAMIWP